THVQPELHFLGNREAQAFRENINLAELCRIGCTRAGRKPRTVVVHRELSLARLNEIQASIVNNCDGRVCAVPDQVFNREATTLDVQNERANACGVSGLSRILGLLEDYGTA